MGALEIMHRLILLSLLVTLSSICTATVLKGPPLVGKPIYFKHINDDVFWENIIVYGNLEKEVIRAPSKTYESSFGHSYCMVQDISFRVKKYIQGAGPDLIEFSQHSVDSCKSLSTDIGFKASILLLSKNKFRGIWTTGSIKIFSLDGEDRIFLPTDIVKFSHFENFNELLTSFKEPYEWGVENDHENYQALVSLKEKGILDFEKVKEKWPKALDAKESVPQGYNEYFLVKINKYIKLDALFENNF